MAWAPNYATATDLRTFKRIEEAGDDAALTRDCAAASRAVDTACRRQFGQVDTAEARSYDVEYDPSRGRWFAVIDDLQDLTNVEVLLDDVDVTVDVSWLPTNADKIGRPYTRVVLPSSGTTVEITGLWGWTAVPDEVVEATLLQASRFTTRRDAPWGIAGSPDMGSQVRLLARVDPDVAVQLAGLVRLGRAL